MTPFDLRPSDDTALVDAASGDAVSYRHLLSLADATAKRVGDERELLFLLCRNDLFTATSYAASLLGGHAVALLDGSAARLPYADLIGAYQPGWILGPRGAAEALSSQDVGIERVHEGGGGELIRLPSPSTTGLHPDLALLLSTSGTTGSRRFVRLSRDNLRSNATAIADYLELGPSERPITSLPLHYTFGLSVLNSHWAAGAAVVLTDESVVQRSFWEMAVEHRASSLAGVPYTYQLLERVGYRDMDLPDVTSMQQAGGALDVRLTGIYADHMAAKGGRFFVMYGQTEATARMAYVPPERLSEKLGSAGKAIAGGRFRIKDTASRAGASSEPGEVVFEGPNVMMGYADRGADLARGDELEGVLDTGDIGRLDDEGYLFLEGRSKRIAKVFGLRVNLDEVERGLRAHGPAAVVGGEDAIWAFCAFGTDESLADLGREMARSMRLHHRAIRLRRVDDIPMSSTGKIDYREVELWTSR